ncbi:hypothetical protein N7501_002605 [Penicillium viridicatum]|nr:hypothetical protein N7501_002605 [Penicillium viridicatum]
MFQKRGTPIPAVWAPERLDAAFQNTREIQLSKADRVVAIEIIYVKSFEEAYKLNPTKPTTVRVFYISL